MFRPALLPRGIEPEQRVVLALGCHRDQVSLDAVYQIRDVANDGRHDDPRMCPPILLPLDVKRDEIDGVERQQRTSGAYSERELLLVRDALFARPAA
jgi:hypothetical protein